MRVWIAADRSLKEGGHSLEQEQKSLAACGEVKIHFCSLRIVFLKWNHESIGDVARNDGSCPGNPDNRRM